jgi:hypothetical protein
MTPEERRLIDGLFDRMRGFGSPEIDREAETLINQSMRMTPNAAYMLVQSVLVQEQALEAANVRVRDLEERVRALEEDSSRPPTSSGSFLGGLFGAGRPASAPEPKPSSVPQVGARSTPLAYEDQRGSAWSQPPPPQPQAPASGGFMRSAMATAAGVAGGMLAAESIRHMMAGTHSKSTEAGEQHHDASKDADYQNANYVEDMDENPSYGDGGDFGSDGDIEV